MKEKSIGNTIPAGMTKERWERLKNMTDDEIDTSDIPDTDPAFWANARVVYPENKSAISMRVDDDILAWFKAQGKGYQTRMNAVLKAYVEAQRRAVKG